MSTLIVVNNPRDWPLEIPGVAVVPARAYLTEPAWSEDRSARVFNLCKSYRYQSLGYYVSLLAAARGHHPLPDANTIEDLKSQTLVRVLTEDLDELIRRNLAPLKSDRFELSIYFGRNVSKRYDALSRQLFNLIQAPLLRARFERHDGEWRLSSLRPIAASEIPAEHQPFVIATATQFFQGRKGRPRRRPPLRYELAILHEPQALERPSNPRALEKFERAAGALGLGVTFVTRDDFARLREFDALFIRATTNVDHYTYRFARRAAAEGLVVIDEPESILKCNNKVYVAELLARHGVPTPRTLLVHRDNVREIVPSLSLPCVLKRPDSSFSMGVVRADSEPELEAAVGRLLERSDLVVAQEYLPTEFDWRVGILDRRVLFVCRYYMVKGHWQVVRHEPDGTMSEGVTEAFAVGEVPDEVVGTALRAANLIGDGLYGVDIKQSGGRCYVLEVNDNPNVDAGNEDGVLKDALYREIMGVFLKRIEERKRQRVGR